MGTSTPLRAADELVELVDRLGVDPAPVVELAHDLAAARAFAGACARCGTDVDDEGYCSLCGAVTIRGEPHVDDAV